MIGTQVEREGIIRHGAKMVSAVSEATVPKISVIVRKAYGAGLYAMAGPAFEPDCCIALPSAHIAVMGPSAAINAVHYNQLQAIEDDAGAGGAHRGAARRVRRATSTSCTSPPSWWSTRSSQPEDLRGELIRRFRARGGRACANGRPSTTRSRPSDGRRPPPSEAELLDVAVEAARAAGAELLARWRRPLEVGTKSTPTDPVTRGRHAAPSRRSARCWARRRPHDSILGEEGGADRRAASCAGSSTRSTGPSTSSTACRPSPSASRSRTRRRHRGRGARPRQRRALLGHAVGRAARNGEPITASGCESLRPRARRHRLWLRARGAGAAGAGRLSRAPARPGHPPRRRRRARHVLVRRRPPGRLLRARRQGLGHRRRHADLRARRPGRAHARAAGQASLGRGRAPRRR